MADAENEVRERAREKQRREVEEQRRREAEERRREEKVREREQSATAGTATRTRGKGRGAIGRGRAAGMGAGRGGAAGITACVLQALSPDGLKREGETLGDLALIVWLEIEKEIDRERRGRRKEMPIFTGPCKEIMHCIF